MDRKNMRSLVFDDPNRPRGECADCGRKYGGVGWIDAVVPDDVWHKIRPVSDEEYAGILCVGCISRRCAMLGLTKVPVVFASGPLTPQITDLSAAQDAKTDHIGDATEMVSTTPLVGQLSTGPWPQFAEEVKAACAAKPAYRALEPEPWGGPEGEEYK